MEHEIEISPILLHSLKNAARGGGKDWDPEFNEETGKYILPVSDEVFNRIQEKRGPEDSEERVLIRALREHRNIYSPGEVK